MDPSSPNMLTPDLTPSQSITSSPSLPAIPDTRPLDIVVAHFNESLDWLSSYADFVSLYSKDQVPTNTSAYREAKKLPNWGRESHTYLHHILYNYDNLADVTLFLQGNIHDINDGTPAHTDLTTDEIVSIAKHIPVVPDLLASEGIEEQKDSSRGILALGQIHSFSDWDGVKYKQSWVERRGKTLQRSKYTPGQFYNYLINGATAKSDPKWADPPAEIKWTQGALFAVTRQTIQARPKEVYERAYKYFHDMESVNPEEGHYMERLWLTIMSASDSIQQATRQSLTTSNMAIPGDKKHTNRVEEEGIFVLDDVS